MCNKYFPKFDYLFLRGTYLVDIRYTILHRFHFLIKLLILFYFITITIVHRYIILLGYPELPNVGAGVIKGRHEIII